MTVKSLLELEGKCFLIIGGGQGMGEASARLLASFGAHIAVLDFEADRAQRVAASLRGTGVQATSVCVDVTQDDELIKAIQQVEKNLGPLDGMAAIVGMAGWSSLVDMTTETWDQDHRRNLRYFFVAAREVAKRLLARQAPGSIVAIASVDGVRSAPFHGSYGAAKAGLLNLVRTMAVEWSESGIRVNAVAPGATVTPRLPLGDPERERQSMAIVPMKRRGTVDDIAKAVAFFLSDMSPYVTGETLAVDGGYLAAGGFSGKPAAPPQGTIGIK